MLPPLSSNRKTETATTVSLVVEDLPKKLTHHFTTLHHCLNFLTQEYDTNWSRWFQGNGYFQHWITFIYRAPMAAIDSRKRQNGESVHQDDWMMSFWDTISQHVQNHNGQQHSTACTVQRRIFLHQKVNDCLNIKERNPWQANDAHNSKTLKVCKFRLSTLKKKFAFNFLTDRHTHNFHFVWLKLATNGMQTVHSKNNAKPYNFYSVSSYVHHKNSSILHCL